MSISWIGFETLSPIALAFGPTAGIAVRSGDWMDLGSQQGEHHEYQVDYV